MSNNSFLLLDLLLLPPLFVVVRLALRVENTDAVIKKLPRVLMASTLMVLVGVSLCGALGSYWMIPVVVGELFCIGAIFQFYAHHKNDVKVGADVL